MEKHTTVLLTEAVDALAITSNATVVDATLGAGGHAREIIKRLGPDGHYIGIDADPEAVQTARKELHGKPSIDCVLGNFRDIDSLLNAQGITAADAILADLGWRMEQMSGNGKGFSFLIDEPLLMTFGEPEKYQFTAEEIVNEWDEEHLINILEGYGEERYARRIARAIVGAREKNKILRTAELVSIIAASVPPPYRHGKLHPATRTFQALRITVNDELGALSTFLEKAIVSLRPGGRIAVITFHSLEDRVVKHTFRNYVHDEVGEVLTKKPILPSKEEINANRRARSAKLRIFKKHLHDPK